MGAMRRRPERGMTDRCRELINRFQRYLIFLGEYLFLERPRGLDFTMRDTGLYQKSAGKYHGYSKTDERHLREIFASLDFSRCRRLLDVGCGKGVVLKEAAKFPFEKIAGIELQEELVKTAEKTFVFWGLRKEFSVCRQMQCILTDTENMTYFSFLILFPKRFLRE